MSETNTVTEDSRRKKAANYRKLFAFATQFYAILAAVAFPAAYIFNLKYSQTSDVEFAVLIALCILIGVYASLMTIVSALEVHFHRLESGDRRREWSEKESG